MDSTTVVYATLDFAIPSTPVNIISDDDDVKTIYTSIDFTKTECMASVHKETDVLCYDETSPPPASTMSCCTLL
jgi:hypothetical protein